MISFIDHFPEKHLLAKATRSLYGDEQKSVAPKSELLKFSKVVSFDCWSSPSCLGDPVCVPWKSCVPCVLWKWPKSCPLWAAKKHLATHLEINICQISHTCWELSRLLFNNTPVWSVYTITLEVLLMVQQIRTHRKQISSFLVPPSGWGEFLKMLLFSGKYFFYLSWPQLLS